jgi:hypothetical protein
MPFCDQALPLDARLDDMLARMPFHEALQQTQANSAGAPSVGRSPWAESDFTHLGPALSSHTSAPKRPSKRLWVRRRLHLLVSNQKGVAGV